MPFVGAGDGSRINALSDGTLLLVLHGWMDPDRKTYVGEVILRSTDNGRNWGNPTVLPPGFSESNLLELPSGRLLMVTRYQRWGAH